MQQQTVKDAPRFPKLHEFEERAKAAMAPGTLLKNPWVRIGLGFAIGYALGSRRRGPATPNHETIFHAIVRTGLAAAAAMLVRQAFEEPQKT